MANSRANARPHTKMILWGRAGGRCQYKNCNVRLDGDLVSGNMQRNGAYVAHIIAADPGGARGDPVLSSKLADDPENLMLLCDIHHRAIDDQDKLHLYTVEVLRQMKRDHEERVDRLLSIRSSRRSTILQVSAPIGPNETAIPFDDCAEAVVAEAILADRQSIEIKLRGMRHKDSDPDYYKTEIENLRRRFRDEVAWKFEEGQIEHLSIFALAPIPILMELGRLVSDISDASVFMRHREPKPQWAWPNDGANLGFSRTKGPCGPSTVALKLSVSAQISDDRIAGAVGDDVSIWELRSSEFGTSVLRNQSDLTQYRLLVGRVLDEIRVQHGSEASVSIFPAIPTACAVEFGRVWQPKGHLPLDIFDETAGEGFLRRYHFE